jgi:glycine C-acetyltransferase
VADFHDMDDSILYASCFDANAGIFETLLGPDDAVFSDELNHASIIDGIRLCKAQKARYLHRDMADLDAQLTAKADAKIKLIVSDGVFSMDGTVAPLAEICDLADKHGALVFLDECHATGMFGATGRGTAEHCGVEGRIDIINSTMGKALGGAMGGYTTGPQELIDVLRQRARPYLFSNTLPPAVVGATNKVFELIKDDSTLVEKLGRNVAQFTNGMTAAGFTVGGDPAHPICPIHLGDARLATEFADEVLDLGIFVIGFSFPVVPKGKARIRCQISAAHSEADIDHAIASFAAIGKAKGLIK